MSNSSDNHAAGNQTSREHFLDFALSCIAPGIVLTCIVVISGFIFSSKMNGFDVGRLVLGSGILAISYRSWMLAYEARVPFREKLYLVLSLAVLCGGVALILFPLLAGVPLHKEFS